MSVLSKSIFIGAFVASTGPAWAGEIAKEVLDEFVSEMALTGYSAQIGTKTERDGRVEWRDVVMINRVDHSRISYPSLFAEEIAPGTVKLSFPDEIELDVPPAKNVQAFRSIIRSNGFADLVTGTAQKRSHHFGAESFRYAIRLGKDGGAVEFLFRGMTSNFVASGHKPRRYQGEGQADYLEVTYRIGPDSSTFNGKMVYENATLGLAQILIAPDEIQKLMGAQEPFVMQLNLGGGEQTINVVQKDFNGTIKTATVSSGYKISIENGVVLIGAEANGGKYELAFTDLPLPPLSAEVGKLGIDMAIPMRQQKTPLDAKLVVKVAGLEASDTLWGIVDPTGVLPRDPVSLIVDLSGAVMWFVDPMDDKARKDMMAGSGHIGELSRVTLNRLLVEIAGARLLGDGSVDVDNSGYPKAGDGVFDFALFGGMGLLGKLVEMGLVQPRQRMMTNVLAGLYTVPAGDGLDHIKSHVETRKGGAVFVNGNQVQ